MNVPSTGKSSNSSSSSSAAAGFCWSLSVEEVSVVVVALVVGPEPSAAADMGTVGLGIYSRYYAYVNGRWI